MLGYDTAMYHQIKQECTIPNFIALQICRINSDLRTGKLKPLLGKVQAPVSSDRGLLPPLRKQQIDTTAHLSALAKAEAKEN